MIYIGCHLSVVNGYEAMGRTMSGMGGNTFAWFTRNPRGGKTKPLDEQDALGLMRCCADAGFGPLVAHGSYTMNLCSANERTRENGLDMLRQDLLRLITDVENLCYIANENKSKADWSDQTFEEFSRIKHKLLDKAGDIGRLPENITLRTSEPLNEYVARMLNEGG